MKTSQSNSSKLKKTLCLSFVLFFIFNIKALYSQTQNDTINEPTWGGFFDIGMQHSTVNDQVAVDQGFPNEFYGLTLGLGIFRDFLLAGFKFSGELPEDIKPFTNMTTQGRKTSHVELTQFSLYAGLVSPKLIISEIKKTKIFLFGTLSAGNMWAFGEERSINGCSDCDVEELSVSGGAYINPEVYFVYEIIGLGFGYRHFFNGDYNNKMELKLSIVYYE